LSESIDAAHRPNARTIGVVSSDADHSRLRISDADRSAAAERLRIALVEGRIGLTEYDTRLQAAYAATTYGELEPITADLPAVPEAKLPAVAKSRAVDQRHKWLNEWREWIGGAVIMIAIWGTTSLVGGELTPFWPAIPLGIWAAVLLASAISKKA
jgi:hypothetical protein